MTARHIPTDEQRKRVWEMTAAGIGQEQICAIIGISGPTLRLHYKRELETAIGDANNQVARSLFTMATNGNVAAAIFWMKTRARWRETAAGHDDEGKPFVVDTGVNRD